jgi:hypothetical protein
LRRSRCLFLLLLALPAAAAAFSANEATDGDFSNDRLAPTTLVASSGSNTLSGTTVVGDLDYVRISLPAGFGLTSLVLDAVTSADDLAFIAVQQGTTFSVTPATATASVLLGYAHFGTGPAAGDATPGNDILDDLAKGFNAIGFTPPLTATDYTFWIQQTAAQSFGYSFDFVVSEVPEPGTGLLLAAGLAALAARRGRA